MSYKDFTLEKVRKQLGGILESDRDLFAETVRPCSLAIAIGQTKQCSKLPKE